jgi:MFS transporter, SHS family, lactate transporter
MSSTAPIQPQTASRDGLFAFLAGTFGWTLDAFDFFLVVFCLTAIGREFHKNDAAMSLAIVMTLAFRPLGGFLFGMLADRYGRRRPMIWNLALCGFVQLVSGIAPNYAIFLASRAAFGVIMGGQWGVGASLAMEKVPLRWRGLLSGILQQGYAAGYLLAALCYFLMIQRFGWRPLFFVACLPALAGALFTAREVRESEVWQRARARDSRAWLRDLLSNWKLLVYITLFAMTMHMCAHGSQDMYPAFLERQWHFGPSKRAALAAFSMVGAIAGGTLCGHLSDRWGRRKSIVVALGGALLVTPLWAFAPNVVLLAVGAFLMQFLIQGAWGVVPAHLTELSPDALRGFVPGFGNACGVVLASSVVYIEAALAKDISYAVAMAWTAGIVLLAAIAATALGGEKKAAVFGA